MIAEIWKPIPGWPKYAVSNLGRVKRLRSRDARDKYWLPERILKPVPRRTSKWGYRLLCLTLSDGERSITVTIAKLVLLAFVGPPPSARENFARHLDDDSFNNRLDNLSWGSKKDNELDRIKNERVCKGEDHGRSILTRDQVLYIKSNYILYSKDFSCAALSKRFGVTPSTVEAIVSGKIWKHVALGEC